VSRARPIRDPRAASLCTVQAWKEAPSAELVRLPNQFASRGASPRLGLARGTRASVARCQRRQREAVGNARGGRGDSGHRLAREFIELRGMQQICCTSRLVACFGKVDGNRQAIASHRQGKLVAQQHSAHCRDQHQSGRRGRRSDTSAADSLVSRVTAQWATPITPNHEPVRFASDFALRYGTAAREHRGDSEATCYTTQAVIRLVLQ
jgi:hypothetical protein